MEKAFTSFHLNTERSMRGGEVQCLALVSYLAGKGLPCALVAREGGALLERAAGAGVPVRPWRPWGELDPAAAARLRAMVPREGATILHAHTAHALTLALMARAGLRGVKVVASRRVSFPLRSFLSRRKYRSADAVVAVSGQIRNMLIAQGILPQRVRVIPSGVDLGRFRNPPSREEARAAFGVVSPGPVIGVVGALAAHKGHALLFDALDGLSGRCPGLTVLLAGDGELREELGALAASRDLPVRFLGFVAEPAGLYPALDLLVLPSLSGEGSPGVVKEAAATGVPVVATEVGGTEEILRQGEEALLVPPGDVPALRGAILRALTEEGLAARLARSAGERVTLFRMESMGEAHLALYREILG